ncbi:hypothetical protein LOTGIDRAFT_236233 [Lottia gigantea]|uniref:Major facilitator superfamily (MFS) profile domain-containing protein n=1 Tax=Lottia gigantea TaxID=225164 RepID=V3ZQ04_LOTGI|nr:hypothetical protein LOTGIDRAFT_236233 [Lottia gigantea]ESO84585.1 hypothetical protein LOTGIDRAFT_236233 [Lottia gigantea]
MEEYSEECQEKRNKNIDGGYAWVVLAATFVANMFQMAYFRAFGLLFVKFLDEFGAPVSYTSTVMGVSEAMYSISTLMVMGILLDYCSIRKFAMFGAAICAIGVSISALAMSVEFIIFSQSCLVGIGHGCSFGPSMVLLGRNFKKRQGFAMAISNAGVSAGVMLMPQITTHLLDNYGLRGTQLILGGVMAQAIVCAALYRDPEKSASRNQSVDDTEPESKETMLNGHVIRLSTDTINIKESCSHDDFRKRLQQSLGHDLQAAHQNIHSSENNIYALPQHKRILQLSNASSPAMSMLSLHSVGHLHPHAHTRTRSHQNIYTSSPSLVDLVVTSVQNFPPQPESKQEKLFSKFKKLLDLSLFKTPMFWILVGYWPISRTGILSAESFIPALAIERGLSDYQASLLLTVIGLLDIIFRVVAAFIIQFQLIKGQYICIFSLVMLGIMFEFVSYYRTFVSLMAMACVFGVLNGTFFSLLGEVVIDLVGYEQFAKVFGFVQIFSGACSLTFYPIIGSLKDLTNTYTSCFQLIGACLICGGVVLALEPLARRPEKDITEEYSIVYCEEETTKGEQSKV